MQRITHPSAVLVEPNLVEAGNVGYFDDQTPGAETIITGRWLNRIQNELENVCVGLGGLALAAGTDLSTDIQLRLALGHTISRAAGVAMAAATSYADKAASASSGAAIGAAATRAWMGASQSCAIDTDTNCASMLAADTCTVHEGSQFCATLASRHCEIGFGLLTTNGAALASRLMYIDGNECAAIASSATAAAYVAGDQSVVIASLDSGTNSGHICQAVIASDASATHGNCAVVQGAVHGFATNLAAALVGSRNCENHLNYSLAGGYDAGAAVALANADQNLTWRLDSTCSGGVTGSADGTWTSTGVDYAEYFPNVEAEVIPVGSLVSRAGRNVRMAVPGDRILGVVSAQPSVVGGDGAMHWSGKYERDLFGGYVFEVDANGVMARKLNPDYDSAKEAEYQGRAKRPEEWTCVGLLGQLHVRIDDTVTSETLFVEPGTDGRGTATDTETRCEVMEITTPYTKKRGYGVALCLVR